MTHLEKNATQLWVCRYPGATALYIDSYSANLWTESQLDTWKILTHINPTSGLLCEQKPTSVGGCSIRIYAGPHPVCAGFTSCKSYEFFCASSLFPLPKALKGARAYIYFGLQCALCKFPKRLPWFIMHFVGSLFLKCSLIYKGFAHMCLHPRGIA